ncbi:MAG: hypothetical protein HW421_1790 [Ignavibacteria bacterium]|nr:hypothetical protein [Ignavibacteria bacterium]
MRKNSETYRQFEDDFIKNESSTLEKRFKMFDDMTELARKLAVPNRDDFLLAISSRINIAKAINAGFKSDKEDSANA